MTDEEFTEAEEIAITNMIGKNPETLAKVIVQQEKEIGYWQKQLASSSWDHDRACDVLESLFAIVMGECPSLLKGHFLYDKIKEVLE